MKGCGPFFVKAISITETKQEAHGEPEKALFEVTEIRHALFVHRKFLGDILLRAEM